MEKKRDFYNARFNESFFLMQHKHNFSRRTVQSLLKRVAKTNFEGIVFICQEAFEIAFVIMTIRGLEKQ